MTTDAFQGVDLQGLAARVGTPFYVYDAAVLYCRIATIQALTAAPYLQARYAMKACSAGRILQAMRDHGIWIDAVSGNEVLRAKAAGYPMGAEVPEVMLSTDVFRDNALDIVRSDGILPNIGSRGMLRQLLAQGYRGALGLRLNPGFGHGHVQSCDTGGPSSKHGIWADDALAVAREAEQHGIRVTLLHAHVGSGPTNEEFYTNMQALVSFFAECLEAYPHVNAVNLGGGIPHPYRPGASQVDLEPFGHLLREGQERLSQQAGRPIRVEIEPGRYFVAPVATLVSRVTDIKQTRTNAKGPGQAFVMVDAGFCDLVRPAMYGSYHHISVWNATADAPQQPVVVAGPLCESGDVFTRDDAELLQPRSLPPVHPGDLVLLHDAGAYGATMSSNYNSIGRVPQVWLENGKAYLMSRRETFEDLMRTECFTVL